MKDLGEYPNVICCCRDAEKNCDFVCKRWVGKKRPSRLMIIPTWPIEHKEPKKLKP